MKDFFNFTLNTMSSGPLVKWDLFESMIDSQGWTNIEICSDKEHPLTEQYEDKDGNLVMRIALAGYPKESISVTHADNLLVVSANKVEDEHRSLAISKRACKKEFVDNKGLWDFFSLKASYKDGLLTLKIPKKKEKQPIKVEIES